MAELKTKTEEFLQTRTQLDREIAEQMHKKPRFAVTPSPDALDTSLSSPGQDLTDTMGDFAKVINWLKGKGLEHIFYKDAIQAAEDGKNLQGEVFNALILFAFKNVFDHIRNTDDAAVKDEELVFWYYAGHGLDPSSADALTEEHYTPDDPVYNIVNCDREYFQSANEFFSTLNVEPTKSLRGGELCLHKAGYPGLYRLLKPWISALKTHPPKENKHLVLVLDSCYSGQLARQLQESEWLSINEDLWKKNGCSVTVQAACGPDESTFGGYFTPCFHYLNQPENEDKLEEMKRKWKEMTQDKKEKYIRQLEEIPSPQVVATKNWSTSEDDTDPTTEITIQGFKMTLFHDAAFFKFCYLNLFQGVGQPLTEDEANQFLRQSEFDVLDYKLKKVGTTGDDTLLGLFLVKDPDKNCSFCVRVYFEPRDTSTPQKIELVRYEFREFFYLEETSAEEIHVLKDTSQAKGLLEYCKKYLDSKKVIWSDVSQWNMRYSDKNDFRQKERSQWIKDYIDKCTLN